jgi:cell division protein FtsB
MFKLNGLPKRVLSISGLIILLLIIIGFSRRVAEFTRLSSQLDRESGRITELVSTQAYLQDQIVFATSEAAVEQWAREDGRLAQPGDFAVIPLPQEGTLPQVAEAAEATQRQISNWQTWIEWFFYDGP